MLTLRAVLRPFASNRGVSLMVVGTIAFGLAILSITFGIVNAALFRQPPFPEAGRLAMLYLERNPRGEAHRRERWSFRRFELLRAEQRSFEQVASYSPGALTLAGDGNAELIQGERVSASYFAVLRVVPFRGRVFPGAEDDPARPAQVAVLSHALWVRRWASDPAILGRTIRLNGVTLSVLGILPAGFAGLSGKAEIWVPATLTPALTYAEYLTTNQNFISAVGRLKEGVSLDAAQSELAVLGARINRALPSDPDYPDERVTGSAMSVNAARAERNTRRSLFVLLGAVGVLHLLACANVTNLLLGRAATKERESAVRVALGSTPLGLFRRILREGLVLTATGALLGVGVGWWASRLVTPPANAWARRNFFGSVAPFDAPSFGLREALFGLGLAVVTALLVALPPALTAFRVNVASGIKAGSRGIPGGALRLRRPTARGVLVGIEAALAILLVVAAGLLLDSFRRMQRVDIGVNPAHLLTFWVIPSEARVLPATAPAFVTRLLETIERVPGVVSVTVDGGGPLAGTASNVLFIAGRPMPLPGQAPPVLRHYVGPDHFATMGIPVRRGRGFTRGDGAESPRVTVISETAAERFWPDQNPIGQRVWFNGSGYSSPDSSAEVIGIVGDVVYDPLDRRPNFASFYTPYTQFTYASRMVFVRATGDPMALVPAVRKAVASVDPELAIQEARPLGEVVEASWARSRFDALLFGGFGIAALLLAASGIFAVLSYVVASRTREFGVRIALGATGKRVMGDVLREGLVWPVAGLLVGVSASIGLTSLLRAALYETSPREPQVFLATGAVLLVVAAGACLLPAWRATRADAMESLRAE